MFRNPAGDFAGRLIEQAGLKGARVGGAEISPVHANFIVNLGGASADDVLALIELARERVRSADGHRARDRGAHPGEIGMRNPHGGGRGRKFPRHETINGDRGSRAREHLARARERDRRRLQNQNRQRRRGRGAMVGRDPHRDLFRLGSAALALILGLGLAALLGERMLGWLGPELASVDTIAIQGNAHLSVVEIAQATGRRAAAASCRASIRPVERACWPIPWIREARVLRLPPSTLLVRVRDAKRRGRAGRRWTRTSESGSSMRTAPPFAGRRHRRRLAARIVGGDRRSRTASPHPRARSRHWTCSRISRPCGAGVLADPSGALALHLPYGDAPRAGW